MGRKDRAFREFIHQNSKLHYVSITCNTYPQALVAPRHRTGAARAQAHTVVQAHTPAPAQAHIPAPAPALARTPAPARTRAPEAPPGGQGVRVQSKGRGQLQQNDRRVQKHKWATPRKKQNTTWELHELHQKKKKCIPYGHMFKFPERHEKGCGGGTTLDHSGY